MEVEEFKNKVRNLLGKLKVMTIVGEKEKIDFLTEIIEKNIDEKSIDELNEKFEKYATELLIKQDNLIKEDDFEYLKNIAEILRNQKIRIEDGVYLENPVFKVTIDDVKEKCIFYFLTKDGAEEFIDNNKILTQNLHTDKINTALENERRKEKIFKVEKNKNLELEKLIEIIKRNF